MKPLPTPRENAEVGITVISEGLLVPQPPLWSGVAISPAVQAGTDRVLVLWAEQSKEVCFLRLHL